MKFHILHLKMLYYLKTRGFLNSYAAARLLPLSSFVDYRICKEPTIMKIKLGTNFTVFLLFFGVAAIEAFQSGNWIKAGFWLAIGIVFLAADNLKKTDVRV